MEILSSRVLLKPCDFVRSLLFYREVLGLHVYREWGSGYQRGVVFFLGGGFLELSTHGADEVAGDATRRIQLWLQVPDIDDAHEELAQSGSEILEEPCEKPWGLLEMKIADPDGVPIVLVEVPPDHPLRRRPRCALDARPMASRSDV